MNTDPIIRVKRSLVAGKIPTVEQLGLGEIAINHYDGKLFIRQDTLGVGIGTTVTAIGLQGPQGAQGVQGATGAQGLTGNATLTLSKNVVSYSATEGQTSFSALYSVGYVDVFLNGAKLSTSQYTATNGTSVSLNEGASLDDIVEIVGYTDVSVSTIGIATAGGTVGTGVTLLDFRGSGISTITVSSGIATINIEGGGGSSTPDISPVMMGMIF